MGYASDIEQNTIIDNDMGGLLHLLLWLSVLWGNHNTKIDQEVSVMYIAFDDPRKIALKPQRPTLLTW